MKSVRALLLLSIILLPSLLISCKNGMKNKVQYEVFDKNMQTFAEDVKRNYEEHGLRQAVFYNANDSIFLVAFGYVASCQKDTLQQRLSKERASSNAMDHIFTPLFYTNNEFEVYDSSAPFVQDEEFEDFESERENADYYQLDSLDYLRFINHILSRLLIDHIVQATEEKGMRPLLKFAGEEGETVYGYYISIPKSNNWKKITNLAL